ncbi:hypothetical protein F5X97DRAFT_340617 [Nemania serpens]|nr:hypothetical protein F5X97DRAFT_340617 [Nemania serpens]
MESYSELKNVEEQISLNHDDDDSDDGPFLSTTTRRKHISPRVTLISARFKGYWPVILIHLGLIAIHFLILALYASKGSYPLKCEMESVLARNPLKNKIVYEEHRFELQAIYAHNGTVNRHKPTNFTGPPRPELEEAWDSLMKNSEVRVSKEELGGFKNDDSIVELSDGSGYYVTISAYHGLHCVRRLHKYIWADHYYPEVTEREAFLLKGHTEHCLDWLRQYVQCHADPTLSPIHWTTVDGIPVSKDVGNRMCVSWGPFEEWMAEHSFDPFEPGLLVHPLFGVPQTIKEVGKHVEVGLHESADGRLLHSDGEKGMKDFIDEAAKL